jgi:hypothetical protein
MVAILLAGCGTESRPQPSLLDTPGLDVFERVVGETCGKVDARAVNEHFTRAKTFDRSMLYQCSLRWADEKVNLAVELTPRDDERIDITRVDASAYDQDERYCFSVVDTGEAVLEQLTGLDVDEVPIHGLPPMRERDDVTTWQGYRIELLHDLVGKLYCRLRIEPIADPAK